MIPKQPQILFFITLGLMYAHGLEEILTGFQHTDSFMIFGANLFNTTPEIVYWVFHILLWLSVPILFLVFRKKILCFSSFSTFRNYVFCRDTSLNQGRTDKILLPRNDYGLFLPYRWIFLL